MTKQVIIDENKRQQIARLRKLLDRALSVLDDESPVFAVSLRRELEAIDQIESGDLYENG